MNDKIMLFPTGEIALIEKILNEYHAKFDDFVDIVVLRWADGGQTREVLRSTDGVIIRVNELAKRFGRK